MESTQDCVEILKTYEFKALCRAVIHSQAFAKIVRDKVDSYAIPLWQSLNFTVGAKKARGGLEAGSLIDNPKRGYLSDDDDLFNDYLYFLHQEHKIHKFQVDYRECPAKIAESYQVKTKNLLLGYMQEKIGMPPWVYLDDREQMLHLYLSMLTDKHEVGSLVGNPIW